MKHGFIPFTALLLTLLGALNAADSPEGTLSSGEYFIRQSDVPLSEGPVA